MIMKNIYILFALLVFMGCKKDDDPKPKKETKTLTFSGTATGSGAGGNQMEFSINGGPLKIITFTGTKNYDTTATTGDTYYLKVSSLDYSQKIYASVGFGTTNLSTDNCTRNVATPDNCSVVLTSVIP